MTYNNATKKFYKKILISLLIALVLLFGQLNIVRASGITVVDDGDKYLEFGGRIQLQYHYMNPDEGESSDELFFRRLRVYTEGSLYRDWLGKIQLEFGKSSNDNEVSVMDAFIQYKGFSYTTVTVGNKTFPFSREQMTSSKYQELVERTFVGNHNFGVPGRNLGIHLNGHYLEEKKITWGASLAYAAIDPDAKRLDFDSPVNANDDWNEGWMVGGRIDFNPFGYLKFSQGDFKREKKATISIAAYTWGNDDDNNTYTDAGGIGTNPKKPDIDNATGFEVSGAVRGYGVSIDAEYNFFDADTVDPAFTGGLYKNGSTKLENFAVEGGYMIIADKFELVAGYEYQDADGYDTAWTRTSIGANYFFKQHDIKVQLTYRMGENLDGEEGADEDELFLQAQYVF